MAAHPPTMHHGVLCGPAKLGVLICSKYSIFFLNKATLNASFTCCNISKLLSCYVQLNADETRRLLQKKVKTLMGLFSALINQKCLALPSAVTSVLNTERWKALSLRTSFKFASVPSVQLSIICQKAQSEYRTLLFYLKNAILGDI